MSTNKLVREFKRRVTALGCKVISAQNNSGHVDVLLHHADGREQKLTMAGSPRDMNHTLTNTLTWVKRFKENRR